VRTYKGKNKRKRERVRDLHQIYATEKNELPMVIYIPECYMNTKDMG
jgi:hypothetical protein